MRTFVLAAAAALLAATPVAAQTSMTPQEREAFRADWENWSRCSAAANVYRAYSRDEAVRAEYQAIADEAHLAAEALAMKSGQNPEYGQLAAGTFLLMAIDEYVETPALIAPQLAACEAAGIFDGSATPNTPAPAPKAATIPQPSVPLGYTVALSVNGRGGAVTYRRTAAAGQLAGRWSLIDGSIRGDELASRSAGGEDGSLAGTYTTGGTSNGTRYAGRLQMTKRGEAVEGRVRFYDMAWDNGDRGSGLEEGPWLHVVYGAAATGLLTPSADNGGWELVWVGPRRRPTALSRPRHTTCGKLHGSGASS